MLGKLLKHEFKATWRTFMPIYIGLAVFTIAASVFIHIIQNFQYGWYAVVSSFGIFIGVFAIIFIFVSPFIFLSMRFYKTTATREAYLTFIVPADTKTILLSKYIVATVWTALTIVLAYLSIILIAVFWNSDIHFFEAATTIFTGDILNDLLQFVSIFISLINSLVSIFTAIALGQLVRDHRVIASFGFYMAIYTVQQIVSLIITIPYLFSAFEDQAAGAQINDMSSLLVITLIMSAVFIVSQFFLSNYILTKKLNLL